MLCKFLVRKRFLIWYHPAFSLCGLCKHLLCWEGAAVFWYCHLKHVPMYFYWNAVHLQCISHWFIWTKLNCHISNRLLDNFRPLIVHWFSSDVAPGVGKHAAGTWLIQLPFGLVSLISEMILFYSLRRPGNILGIMT